VPASITNQVREKRSQSSLLFVLPSQNQHLWVIGDTPKTMPSGVWTIRKPRSEAEIGSQNDSERLTDSQSAPQGLH